MRFIKFLNEDVIKTALGFDEPKTGKKYSDEYVKKRKETLEKAIKAAENKKFDNEDVREAMLADLQDKLDKWSNVEKETAAPKPPAPPEEPGVEKTEGPPEGKEEIEADAEKEKEAEEKAKEEDEKEAEKDVEREEKKVDREKDRLDREKEREKRKKEDEKRRKKAQEGRLIKSKIRLR